MESLFVAIEDAVVGIGESLRGDIQGDKDGAIVLLENILQRLYHFNTIFILNSNYLQTHNPVSMVESVIQYDDISDSDVDSIVIQCNDMGNSLYYYAITKQSYSFNLNHV